MEQIAAKPTTYNGYLFRSKLEAKWAVFFDRLGKPYEYEPEAFRCNDGSQYTPDFYLPELMIRIFGSEKAGAYLEVKPLGFLSGLPYEQQPYLRRISSALPSNKLCLMVGEPYEVLFTPFNPENIRLCPSSDNFFALSYCDECETLSIVSRHDNHRACPNCECYMEMNTIKQAAIYARQYRFDYLK